MIENKIEVELVGTDGNIFMLVGKTAREMQRAGQREEAEEMKAKVWKAGSYDEALQIIMEYVDVC